MALSGAELVAHHGEELALGAVGRFGVAARGALPLEDLRALHEVVAHVVLAPSRSAERSTVTMVATRTGRSSRVTLARRELVERAMRCARARLHP